MAERKEAQDAAIIIDTAALFIEGQGGPKHAAMLRKVSAMLAQLERDRAELREMLFALVQATEGLDADWEMKARALLERTRG